MAKITLEYYGVEGTGRTVTEAKRDAGRKIEVALTGSYTPEILAWRGWAILVWREIGAGWVTRIIATPEGVREGQVYANTTGEGTLESARSAARRHLADLGWMADDGMDPPPFLSGKEEIVEYRHKAEFQLRYRRARAAGLADNDAHGYAGRDPSRPELIDRVDGAAPAA